MEIQQAPELGPGPSVPAAASTLTRSRRTLLELLEEQRAAVPLTRLAELSGLHENTLRGHLEGLAADGLVSRERDQPHGRGRPAWLWRAVTHTTNEYAGLAATLARTLRRTSSRPEEDAVGAGNAWGHQLAADRPEPPVGTRSTTERVVDLLDGLGFAPRGEADHRSGTGELRLTRCPLLEAARQEPTIVCNVHLGLVAGALEEYGANDPDARLTPFAEPGACLLHMRGETR